MATQSKSSPSETRIAGFGWLSVTLLFGGVLLAYYIAISLGTTNRGSWADEQSDHRGCSEDIGTLSVN